MGLSRLGDPRAQRRHAVRPVHDRADRRRPAARCHRGQRIATGFHRCTTTNVEAGSEPEETRINQVIDRVNTTAAVWLGSTLECSQCHDHKYDPFSQKDYYRLLAFFNNTEIEADRANPKVPGSIRFLGPDDGLERRCRSRPGEAAAASQIEELKQTAGRRGGENSNRDLAEWETEPRGKPADERRRRTCWRSPSSSPRKVRRTRCWTTARCCWSTTRPTRTPTRSRSTRS